MLPPAIHTFFKLCRTAVRSGCVLAMLGLTCTTAKSELPTQAGRAFVDFHARSGPGPFGHSFIVYGRVDDTNRIVSAKIVGLRPKNDTTALEGVIFPLPAKIGRAADDLKIESEVVYRRFLTGAKYRQLATAISRIKATEASWHLIFFNCNDFVGEMAESIGLHRPPNSVVLPVSYVAMLRAQNR
jgi:hypothetical protein